MAYKGEKDWICLQALLIACLDPRTTLNLLLKNSIIKSTSSTTLLYHYWRVSGGKSEEAGLGCFPHRLLLSATAFLRVTADVLGGMHFKTQENLERKKKKRKKNTGKYQSRKNNFPTCLYGMKMQSKSLH